jgi:natural product biosynthesis luciferase-like monooxygenase protein
MTPGRQKTSYRLSPIQEGMLFHHLNAKHSGIDIEQIVCSIREPIQIEPMKAAWRQSVQRHDVMRTSFHWQNCDEPYQSVQSEVELPFDVHDMRGLSAAQQQSALEVWLRGDRASGFELDCVPLLRLNLFRLADDAWTLVWTFHHAILDGRSFPIVLTEVFRTYDANRRGENLELSAVRPYADYIEWLNAQDFSQAETFWRSTLQGFGSPTELTTLEAQGGEGGCREEEIELSTETTQVLRELASREGFTVNNTVQAAWALLLSRYSGTSDVVFGATRACRGFLPDARSMAGTFINTLPVRLKIEADTPAIEWLRQIRASQIAVRDYEHTPLTRVQSWSELPAGSPLFESILVFDHAALNSQMQSQEVDWANREVELREHTNFPVTLYAYAEPNLRLRLAYDGQRFGCANIQRALGHLRTILEDMATGAGQRVADLQMLSQQERQELIETWNDTAAEYRRDKRIHELIEEQAQRLPNDVAIVFRNETITRAELNRRADQLAGFLIQAGVQPENRVGVCMGRSIDMVVALLAVMKSGGAYVPIDPHYPRERIQFVIEDAQASVILTEERLRAEIPASGARVIAVDSEWNTIASTQPAPAPALDSGQLAYVIYTSGSTGKPKGVMVTHRNVVNFFTGLDQNLKPQPGNPGIFLSPTSISFDISVLGLFWTLSRGFRVVVQEDKQILPDSSTLPCQLPARPIEFSLFYFASDQNKSGGKYDLLVEGAKFADLHGFSAVWTPERHFHEFGGAFPNPSVLGAALAMITKNLQIRAGSVVMPLHDPIRVAEEWAVVDQLSQGRVGISIASGWHDRDFVFAPDAYADRKAIMMRDLEQVRALWRGEKITRRSGSGNDVEVGVFPRPVQPELPVWITAGGDPNTFRAAGEAGANLLTHLLGQRLDDLQNKIAIYRKAIQENKNGAGHVTLMLHTFVGNSREEVERVVREPLCNYLKSSAELMKQVVRGLGEELGAATLSKEDLAALIDHAFERYYATSGLFGTPESCLATVRKLQQMGVDEIACLVDFGIEERTVLTNLDNLHRLLELANRPETGGYSIPEQIVRHRVTHMQCTPSLARMLVNHPVGREAISQLNTMLVGGEALPPQLAHDLLDTGAAEIWNMYGPTETTIWSTMDKLQKDAARISIGRPIANTKLFILDENRRLVPMGVAGELYIGGEGVARGYLNRPELTAERFVEVAMGDRIERLYRTGDLVRYLPDSRVEFLGRMDNQVKIRGYRIELGEIETLLCSHPLVREAVVSAAEDADGDKALAAYIIPRNGEIPSAHELRRFLSVRLPSPMVPSAFVPLDAFPLTPNRKIDRSRLPKPQLSCTLQVAQKDRAREAPADEIESRLADVWRHVLGLNSVGVEDDFFELGGHSLKAVRLFSAVKSEFNVDLPLATLLQAPTVRGLASILRDSGVDCVRSSMVTIQRSGTKPPIFCIGALDGELILFRRLIAELGNDQPVYGLQPFGLNNHPAFLTDVKKVAAFYVEQVRASGEDRPYSLVGYSFGGLVALEMAQQLQESGAEVPATALIDTHYPMGCKIGEKLQDRIERYKYHIHQVVDGPKGFGHLTERLTFRGRNVLLKAMCVTHATSSPLTNDVETMQQFAADRYQAAPYSGRVCIFRASTQREFLHGGPMMGWDGIFGDNLAVYDIPGDHGTINTGENVALMAKRLVEFLSTAGSSSKATDLSTVAS